MPKISRLYTYKIMSVTVMKNEHFSILIWIDLELPFYLSKEKPVNKKNNFYVMGTGKQRQQSRVIRREQVYLHRTLLPHSPNPALGRASRLLCLHFIKKWAPFSKTDSSLPLSDKGGVMALCDDWLSEDGEGGDDKLLVTAEMIYQHQNI